MADDRTTPSSANVVQLAARAHENDRYLAALLSPRAIRDDLIALAAFAGEIGRVPAFVTEPMMGRIRFQWWRERLETATASGHPVAEAIIGVMERHHIAPDTLTALIDAYEDSLEEQPFSDRNALDSYLDGIDGTLFATAARIAGEPADASFVKMAGRAYGLARLLLEMPAAIAHGRLLIPSADATLRDRPKLQAAVRALGSEARRYLGDSAVAMQHLTRRSRSPFLPLALVEPYLQVCEARSLPDEAPVEVAPLLRMWRLLRCRWTGRV